MEMIINRQGEAMQSEEIETVTPLPEVSGEDIMTFTENKESPSQALYDDSKYGLFSPTPKFEGINLEDDIEKVEVSSNGSSEETETPSPSIHEQNPNESIKSWLQRITELHKTLNLEQNPYSNDLKPLPPQQQPPPSRVVKYQDLPYMGEMTLDNSKPRRGRKPKKADICHLIYKNYGTIFPGTPNPKSYLMEKDKKTQATDQDGSGNKCDVRNKMLSSLLEKRLTQDINKKTRTTPTMKVDQNEPLNLCIRDLNHLKIRLLKKNDNTYTSEIKSEPASDDDVELIDTLSPTLLKNDSKCPPSESPELSKTPDAPGGYVYWPNAGVFIHPMALQQHLAYYQRMATNNTYTLPSHSSRLPPLPHPPLPALVEGELKKLVPKSRRKTDDDGSNVEMKVKRNASTSCTDKTPTKRKRSAIFIPPITPENNTNSATEVSICKFKFTGGAKPSLQEKKMLSVDSGGNFRYYSGTGDKSMRGYEFFPRETLQQQINSTQGSSTGAFLQASGEKIYPLPSSPTSVDFTGNKANSDFLMTPEIPVTPLQIDLSPHQAAQQIRHNNNKKRKSRKSLQREKLEQTFKEKGFLIQTQQLESAEGATYCKFRQLRKFTRYLFRSWKDYLPGNVRELQDGDGGNKIEEDLNEVVDNSSSEHSNNNVPL